MSLRSNASVYDQRVRVRIVENRDRAAPFASFGGMVVAFGMLLGGAPLSATTIALLATAVLPVALLRYRPRKIELNEGDLEATAFSVAPQGTGFSVALATKTGIRFLEVDTLDDAKRLAKAHGLEFPSHGELVVPLPRQTPGYVVGFFSLVALAFASFMPMYAESAGVPHEVIWLALVVWVIAGPLMLRLHRPMQVAWGGGAARDPERILQLTPYEDHVRCHLESRLMEDPAPPRVRVHLLAQGTDSLAAWLTRIDALAKQGGYRGDAESRAALEETVADATVAIDIRMAAARLLHVREGIPAATIAARIEAPDVRTRIEGALLESPDEAAGELTAQGPLFRTR